MGSVAMVIRVAKEERVLPVFPQMVELRRVPERFVRDLRDPNRMRCRARAGVLEGADLGVVHMGLMVGTIDVDAVPAAAIVSKCGVLRAGSKEQACHLRGEVVHRHDAIARLLGEAIELGEASRLVLQPDELQSGVGRARPRIGLVIYTRVPNNHAEALNA